MPYLSIHSSSLIFILILPFLFFFSFLIPYLPIHSSSIFFLFILYPISSYSFFIHYLPNHSLSHIFLFILHPLSSYSFFIPYLPIHSSFIIFLIISCSFDHYPAIFFLFIPAVLKILSIYPVLLLNFQVTIPYLLIHLPKLYPTLLNKIFLSYP